MAAAESWLWAGGSPDSLPGWVGSQVLTYHSTAAKYVR